MKTKYHVTCSFSLRFNPTNNPTRITSISPERIFQMSQLSPIEASKARIGRRKLEPVTNATVSTSNQGNFIPALYASLVIEILPVRRDSGWGKSAPQPFKANDSLNLDIWSPLRRNLMPRPQIWLPIVTTA